MGWLWWLPIGTFVLVFVWAFAEVAFGGGDPAKGKDVTNYTHDWM